MNAPTKIETTHNADCKAMMANVERWRGQCIDSFAQLEVIVENLLRDLHDVPKKGSKVRTGQLVSVAFGHLRELTSAKGAFGQKGSKVTETLGKLALWFEWRAHLTHGVLSLWRGSTGNWLLSFAHRTTGGANDPIRFFALPWTEALQMKRDLIEQVDTLRENARALSNSVRTS